MYVVMLCDVIAGSVVPGGGAFEVAAHAALTSTEFMSSIQGRAKYGVTVRNNTCACHCNPLQ